jgi:glycyl-tRNA synthetase alpha subunit
VPPENPAKYPEPGMFGEVPAYALYFRHVNALEMEHVKVSYQNTEERIAVVLDDVQDVYFENVNLQQGSDSAPYFDLRNVSDFSVKNSRNIKDKQLKKLTKSLSI